jgi:8-oxo-dGTP diphosphatase
MSDERPHRGEPKPDADSSPSGGDRIEVSAGVIFRNGLLLITQRRPADHLGGLWEFPGGKRHANESDKECLQRELLEELGIEVEIKELITTVEHDYAEKNVRLKFFRCLWKAAEPRALGCQDFVWVGRNQLAGYSFPDADRQLLQQLASAPELWQ